MTRQRAQKEALKVVRGSGNIFADLGFADADARLAKAELARTIRLVIQRREMTQRAAAEMLRLATSDVSDLCRGKLARFSQERLERCLLALGMNVTIQITPKAARAKRAQLAVACDSDLALAASNSLIR